MTYIIDAHEDLAYLKLNFNRDIFLSNAETRALERQSGVSEIEGEALISWDEYQKGQVALVFATLFATPSSYNAGDDRVFYRTDAEARAIYQKTIDLYTQWCEEKPNHFRQVKTRRDLQAVLAPWEAAPADYPAVTHPVGLLMLMEGAEGMSCAAEIEEYWALGVRIAGPVWAGIRFCGGTYEGEGFTSEGYELLERMADLGMILDVSHMNEKSILQALERYPGQIIASHSNVRKLADESTRERHLTDVCIRRLVERGGIIGVLPYNGFIKAGWKRGDPRDAVTLADVIAHIDHICQIAGDMRHVSIGTDFDGGFGFPHVPAEMDTIADLQKLAPALQSRGVSSGDVELLFNGNWRRMLEQNLPE